MDNISCKIGGSSYALNADGTVFDSSSTNVGSWKSLKTAPAQNGLLVTLASGDNPVLAQYEFNQNNQLLVALKNPDGSWTSQQVLNGRLVVHDDQNIGYQLVDDQGNDIAGAITVYGDLRLDGNNDLTITLVGGGVAVINADQVSHDANNGQGTGDDVLILAASTYDYDGAIMRPAEITLPGSFKPAENNLVFEINGNAGVNLTFSGTFKGTSVGFEYHQGNGATTLVFTLSGSYRWNNGSATFSVYLGNSANSFSAAATLNVTTAFDNGKGQLAGRLNFGSSGTGFNLDLTLDVQQKWDANNCIMFEVVASDDQGVISYDIGVEGTATFLNGKLTFAMKFSSTGAVTIDLGYKGNGITIAVNFTFNQGVPSAGVTLSVDISWANGKRVASPVRVS
jgi:hypothetical protein